MCTASPVTCDVGCGAVMKPRALGVPQVAGRKLLTGDSIKNRESSHTDLFLQSYQSCKGPFARVVSYCMSSQACKTRQICVSALSSRDYQEILGLYKV